MIDPVSGAASVQRLSKITRKERQILEPMIYGKPNKIIAYELTLSQRTVENHRAAIMRKTGARTLPDLIRLVLQAGLANALSNSNTFDT